MSCLIEEVCFHRFKDSDTRCDHYPECRLFATCTFHRIHKKRTITEHSSQDRRKIEKEAFFGNLLGIVATNALELGVDIGVLDAVLMLGFPIGGLASFVSRHLMIDGLYIDT